MKIKFLGTAAYEGVPSLFCTCRVCQKAMKEVGRELRSRSQAIINDELLLDFPPDTVWHFQRFCLDWTKIGDCLITHDHSDHLYPEDALMAVEAYSNQHRPLHFYAAQSGYEKLMACVPFSETAGAGISLVEPGRRFTAGEGGKYSVLPLRANHEEATSPVIYSISCEGKRLLYAHDTGVFYEDTWKGLKEESRYDLISLDCTGCLEKAGPDYHMCLRDIRGVLERMRSEKLADEKTTVVLNHFSHNGGLTYEEMCREAEKEGMIVSYDGLELVV